MDGNFGGCRVEQRDMEQEGGKAGRFEDGSDELIAACIEEAQVITYLKLTGLTTALLVNFNVAVLRQGLRRLTNKKGVG